MNFILLQDIKTSITSVYSDKPIVGQLCFAQAVLESRLLGTPSELAINSKNLFGIKAIDDSYIELPTTECTPDCHKTSADFEVFDSYEDCIEWHRELMQHPRYINVWTASTLEDACEQVKLAGYATDPNYPDKLMACYKEAMEALYDRL